MPEKSPFENLAIALIQRWDHTMCEVDRLLEAGKLANYINSIPGSGDKLSTYTCILSEHLKRKNPRLIRILEKLND